MSRFKKVYVEITNVCNLDCDFCPGTKRESAFLDKSGFSHIISEVKPFTNHVYFHVMGEPLLHPDLALFLSVCEQNGLKAAITTNGMLIDEKKDMLLSSDLYKISISLHSFNESAFSMTLYEYLNEILMFTKKAREKTICVLRLWNIDQQNLSQGFNMMAAKKIEKILGLDYSLYKALENNKSVKISNNLYIEKDDKFDWPDMDKDFQGDKVFCRGLRDQIGILSDGTVVPCCLDKDADINLGNIFNTPLSEILSSQRARDIYDGFSQRRAVEPLCQRCGYAIQRF